MNATIAPATKASWKPFVRAIVVEVPADRSLLVVDVAIDDSAAIPSAPPICCEVLIRPGSEPCFGGLHAGERRDRDRHEREAEADADEQEARAAGR